ncbi:MAG: hypothetical protein K940chlam2_01775 [Chlamydiae bacterium]|nr:hypothetical protein [Chlamydiota bacterium]
MSERCTDSIPKEFQKLEFCQSQDPRFATAEAATIRRDRGDAGGSKGWDSGKGKNQFWKFVGYQAESRENRIWHSHSQLKDTKCPKRGSAAFRVYRKPYLFIFLGFVPVAGDELIKLGFQLGILIGEIIHHLGRPAHILIAALPIPGRRRVCGHITHIVELV